jgi:acyl-CoA thioester hydrolase
MPAVFEFPHTVREDEIDDQGHVNNVFYVHWMQLAAVEHSSAQGWPPARYLEEGIGWVARSHFIEYLQPTFARDQIVVRTWIANFKKISCLRRYEIVRPGDGAKLAVAETNWAFIGLAQRIPRRIPAHLLESFEVVADAE